MFRVISVAPLKTRVHTVLWQLASVFTFRLRSLKWGPWFVWVPAKTYMEDLGTQGGGRGLVVICLGLWFVIFLWCH